MNNFQKAELKYALQYKVVKNEKRAEELGNELLKKKKEWDPKLAKEAFDAIEMGLSLVNDVLIGKGLPDEIRKEPQYPAMIGVLSDLGEVENAQRSLDMKWMQFYEVVDARGDDFYRLPSLHAWTEFDEVGLTEEIENHSHDNMDVEDIYPRRFGKAFVIARRELQNHPRRSLNKFIEVLRIASMKKKASVGYTALWDQTGLSTETYSNSIIETVNNAYVTLIEALMDNDPKYPVTDVTPAFLLFRSTHKASVNAAFRTISGENGSNIIGEYPVIPVSTMNTNVTNQIAAKNAAIMIVGQYHNVWPIFDNLRIDRGRDSRRDSEEVIAQEYYAENTAQVQKIIVPLQA